MSENTKNHICRVGKKDDEIDDKSEPNIGCNRQFSYKSQLEYHQQIVHVFGYFRCEFCSLLFKQDDKRRQQLVQSAVVNSPHDSDT